MTAPDNPSKHAVAQSLACTSSRDSCSLQIMNLKASHETPLWWLDGCPRKQDFSDVLRTIKGRRIGQIDACFGFMQNINRPPDVIPDDIGQQPGNFRKNYRQVRGSGCML